MRREEGILPLFGMSEDYDKLFESFLSTKSFREDAEEKLNTVISDKNHVPQRFFVEAMAESGDLCRSDKAFSDIRYRQCRGENRYGAEYVNKDISYVGRDYYEYLIRNKLYKYAGKLGLKINQFIESSKPSSTSKAANRITPNDLKDFICREHIRPAICGIYYDPDGFMVASDTRVMAVIRHDIPEDLKGKIVCPMKIATNNLLSQERITIKGDNVIIDLKYPNYETIIPQKEYSKEYKIDLDFYLSELAKAAACEKLLASEATSDSNITGLDMFVKVNLGEHYFTCITSRVKQVFELAKKINADTLRIIDNKRPVLLRSKDNSTVLFMPYFYTSTCYVIEDNKETGKKDGGLLFHSDFASTKKQLIEDVKEHIEKSPTKAKQFNKLLDNFMEAGVKVIQDEYFTVAPEDKKISYTSTAKTKIDSRFTDLKPFMADDKNRPILSGVYCDPSGYMVATDSHALAAIKTDIPEEYSDHVVCPVDYARAYMLQSAAKKKNDMLFIDGIYPKWQSVVPNGTDMKANIAEMEALNNRTLIVQTLVDLALHNFGTVCTRLQFEDGYIDLKPSLFKSVLAFAKKYNATNVLYKSSSSALTFKSKDGSVVLIMPMNSGKDRMANLSEQGLFLHTYNIDGLIEKANEEITFYESQLKNTKFRYKENESKLMKIKKALENFNNAGFKEYRP